MEKADNLGDVMADKIPEKVKYKDQENSCPI